MDILKKMPQDIENKIFYMIAEHPVARVFKEGVTIEKGTFMGDHLLFFWRDTDEWFKNTFLNEGRTKSFMFENNVMVGNIGRMR